MRRLVGIVAVGGAVAIVAGLLARSPGERSAPPAFSSIAPFEEVKSSRLRAGAAPSRPDRQAAPGRRPPLNATRAESYRARDAVAGRLLVSYRDGATGAEIAALLRAAGVRPIRRLPLEDTQLVTVRRGTTVREARAALAASATVAYAEPDFIYRVMATIPDDPGFGDLWGLSSPTGVDIRATDAWTATTGDTSIRVGIVDTGVAYDHPDLAGNIAVNPLESGAGKHANGVDDDRNGYVDDWRGWDWVEDDNDPKDLEGHGTHVAGTIGAAGNNTLGVTGVNWRVGLVPLRVLDQGGSGSTSEIASAFAYAGRNGVDVVNASLGGPHSSQTLLNAITSSPDTLFVVAAGNEASNNENAPTYPCNYTVLNLICVTASTRTDTLATFANYGATSVDLAAPGSGILSTTPEFRSVFEEQFETGVSTNWMSNTWTGATDEYGGYASATGGARYQPGADSSMTLLQPITAGSSDCRLSYALRLDTEAGDDRLLIQSSRNGTDWTTVASESGNTGGWIEATAPVDNVSARSFSLRMRLVADADGAVRAGADIDALEVSCLEEGGSGSYGYASGTSMATPHVAGAAALLRSAAPNTSVADLKTALLKGVTTAPAFAGKTLSGGRLDALASLSLLRPGGIPPTTTPTATSTPRPTGSPDGLAPSPLPSGATPAAAPTVVPGGTPVATPPTSGVDPGSPAGVGHTIELEARRHLRLVGRVISSRDTCTQGVRVRLMRNGERVGRTITDAAGRFRLKLRDRPGAYLAVAPELGAQSCERVSSPVVRHSHAAGAGPTPLPEANCWSYRSEEMELIDATNASRSAFGMSLLRQDPELSRVARVQTARMVQEGALSHTSSEDMRRRITGWTALGENVGFGSSVTSLHNAFMNSPAHRDNILDDFTHIGVGAMTQDDRLWVTVIFEAKADPGTTLDMPDC